MYINMCNKVFNHGVTYFLILISFIVYYNVHSKESILNGLQSNMFLGFYS